MTGTVRLLNIYTEELRSIANDKPPVEVLERVSTIEKVADKIILFHQYRTKHEAEIRQYQEQHRGQLPPYNLKEEGLSAIPISDELRVSFDGLQRQIRAAREALQGRSGGAAARMEKRYEAAARDQGIPLLGGEPIAVRQQGGHPVALDNYDKVFHSTTCWGSRFHEKIGDGGDGIVLSSTWEGRPAAVKVCIDPDDFEKEVMMHLIAPPGTVPRLFAIGPNYFVMERFEKDTAELYGPSYKSDPWINHQIISLYLALAERGIYWLDATRRNLLFRHGDRGEIQIAFCDLAGCAYVKDGVLEYFPRHERFRNCGRTVEAIRQFSTEQLFEHMRSQWSPFFVPLEKKPVPRPFDEQDGMRISSSEFPKSWQEHGGILEQLGFKKVYGRYGFIEWQHPASPPALIQQMGELLGPDFNLKISYFRSEGYADWSAEHRAAQTGPLQGLTTLPF